MIWDKICNFTAQISMSFFVGISIHINISTVHIILNEYTQTPTLMRLYTKFGSQSVGMKCYIFQLFTNQMMFCYAEYTNPHIDAVVYKIWLPKCRDEVLYLPALH